MKRFRILYLSNSGDVGGMENHLLDLVKGMVEKGYKVCVVCPWGEMAERYFGAGAQVRIDRPRLDIDPFYIFRLIKFMRQNKIDILHAHQLKTVVNGLLAAKIAQVPLKVAHIHTPLSQWQISPVKKRSNILVNRLVTNFCADKVIALTEVVRSERIRGEGISPEKIVVIPNGVDVRNVKGQKSKIESATKESKLIVGVLGRLTVEKGHNYFVEAVAVINNQQLPVNNIRFIIAGDGELRSELEEEVKSLGIEGQVTFLGFVPEEKKVEVLSSFDIFVFPSLAEGFGIALVEAMAAGLPCVVSDLPVLQEVGDDAVSFFRTANSDDLAQKILELLEDKKRRRELGRRAKDRVEKEYSLEKFVGSYHRLYQS